METGNDYALEISAEKGEAMRLTGAQYEALLKPLAKHRVSSRQQSGITLSYLEAWDVKAHLIRVFGFGGWSADVLSADLAFEEKDEKGRWNVGYKVVMRLAIDGTSYTEAAVGSSTLANRGEAHDMAVKTAESDALKRAAINLGTQFGLSLYDAGNQSDVVVNTLVPPTALAEEEEEEESVPPDEVYALVTDARASTTEDQLKVIWDRLVELKALDALLSDDGSTPRTEVVERLMEIREAIA